MDLTKSYPFIKAKYQDQAHILQIRYLKGLTLEACLDVSQGTGHEALKVVNLNHPTLMLNERFSNRILRLDSEHQSDLVLKKQELNDHLALEITISNRWLDCNLLPSRLALSGILNLHKICTYQDLVTTNLIQHQC